MSRLRANQITNENANGAPNFPHGLTVTGIVTATTSATTMSQIVVGSAVTANSQGIDVTGIVTATSFKGAATNLTSIPAANITGTLPAISGANLTNLNGSNISSGIVTSARLGGGTASATTFLNGHGNFAEAGLWTKIVSGSGPGATSITIDNIFSDTYDYYKLFYTWAEDDWMKMNYVKADGTVQTGGNYTWTGVYSHENTDGNGRYGNNGQTFGVYSYWNATDNAPAVIEITYYHPYKSSYKTTDFYQCTIVEGDRLYYHGGSNFYNATESHRGVKMFGSGGDNLTSTNFKYLVLGLKL